MGAWMFIMLGALNRDCKFWGVGKKWKIPKDMKNFNHNRDPTLINTVTGMNKRNYIYIYGVSLLPGNDWLKVTIQIYIHVIGILSFPDSYLSSATNASFNQSYFLYIYSLIRQYTEWKSVSWNSTVQLICLQWKPHTSGKAPLSSNNQNNRSYSMCYFQQWPSHLPYSLCQEEGNVDR